MYIYIIYIQRESTEFSDFGTWILRVMSGTAHLRPEPEPETFDGFVRRPAGAKVWHPGHLDLLNTLKNGPHILYSGLKVRHFGGPGTELLGFKWRFKC